MNIVFILIKIILITNSLSAKEEVNLYSARQEVLMRPLIELFENKTKIKVNIVSAKANQLINRIEQEGDYTKADVLLTTDVGRLYIAKEKNIFQKVNNANLDKLIPKNYKDRENYWFGMSLRARFLVYNKDRVKVSELGGYFDLADDKWNGKILVRSSNNVYNQSLVSAMIINYGEKEVEKFLKSFTKNLARKPSGGDRDQIRAIVSGQGDIALVNSYYFLKMKSSDNENKLKNVL